MFSFLFATLLAVSTAAFAAPDIQECEAYPRKAEELGCDQNNFLIKFGYKYCREFVKQDANFTPSGQQILARIRTCLIDAMNSKPELTCSNAKPLAQDDHVRCYIESGYCLIGLGDKFKLGQIVWNEMSDPEFRKTRDRIESGCRGYGY